MSEQTENYIILKPIAERFNKISAEITDDEIRSLIKSELREQVKQVHFASMIIEIAENFVDDNLSLIESLLLDSYKTRLK